jgi:hypothetical protein
MWAVSESEQHKGRVTKSRKMKVGSRGLLYCIETQSLTTPFLVYSKPSVDERIANVWPETWVLPFRIHPLGSPAKQFHKDAAKTSLPSLKGTAKNLFDVAYVQAVTVFVPSKLTDEDWEFLIEELAH